ncbi:hypothetical protein SDC9_61390 [bioreactor metagenome]|uniref:Uncharacterized protein n=1 Tax=bioreactor metagenome TaxID=1076179 RepID=A0A644XFN1_9ZZZZ
MRGKLHLQLLSSVLVRGQRVGGKLNDLQYMRIVVFGGIIDEVPVDADVQYEGVNNDRQRGRNDQREHPLLADCHILLPPN